MAVRKREGTVKVKRVLTQWAVILLFILLLGGCGKDEEYTETITEYPEAPEGYVYDYQVAEEPIPEEIAALGDPVYKNIHMYPSRIQKELMRLELEKRPDLKAEDDAYREMVRQYLLDRYQADCEVELSSVSGNWDSPWATWGYRCTDKRTSREFEIYCDRSYDIRKVDMDGYMDAELGDSLLPQLEQTVDESFEEDFILKVFCEPNEDRAESQDFSLESLEGYYVYVHLFFFTDEEVVKKEEQKSIIEMFKKISYLRKADILNLYIHYYPSDYESFLRQKYLAADLYDVNGGTSRKNERGSPGEKAVFSYREIGLADTEKEMDKLLKSKKRGTLGTDKIWEWWVK